ncbi:FAD-dependent oxidoreductase [Candidatus Kirkpatrickella diaphorinae]|uniref:D-amino-acid oxidase n=1 Tax=Candidatus Kirkpatrickella diaphorinae TaxID=2984322 RepID=A0ABY6GKY9_9PROT|nr:FAD-dependent oxidoreductase [Candidatus Kirkpatrickella diaphorinae]UYH51987.1 FAD-dependent oxidoreductase [Candidatus Kirkpatrickella diaphorinae]
MSEAEADFAVLGRGVAALTCATMLHDAGYSVEITVPDGASAPISHLAGGMLAPYCEGETAPAPIVTNGQRALSWWSKHVPGVQHNGTLVVAPPRDQGELERFSQRTSHHRWVEPGEIEPDLADQFSRGLFFPDEGHLDPRKALASLENRLRTENVAFSKLPHACQIIDCRALQSADHLSGLRGVRGEMLIVRNSLLTLSRPIRLLHPRFPCYIVPRDDGVYMIGATMVETGFAGRPTAQSVMALLSAAYSVHPSFAEAEILEMGAGVRPAFEDNIPRVIYEHGRWHVNGMYRHGFLMAPYCAETLIHLLQEVRR